MACGTASISHRERTIARKPKLKKKQFRGLSLGPCLDGDEVASYSSDTMYSLIDRYLFHTYVNND
jgi:hypothetical protein